MIIANFTTKNPNMGKTETYEDFYKMLSAKPTRLGVVARLYPQITSSYVTESLGNLVEMDSKSSSAYRSIDSMYYEWKVETNYIKRVEFAEVPTTLGEDGSEIEMIFKENYYQKYDIFKIDATMQQCFVTQRPRRKADDRWVVTVRLIDNDYSSVLDLSGCQIGMTTRFQSNAMPEGHEEGYSKFQSNIEKHRNWITTHRVDASRTSLMGALEHVFVNVKEGKSKDQMTEKLYKMDTIENRLLENFLFVRDSGNLFNKTNVDENGKPTIFDKDLGRPIYIGDGILPQIERYANTYAYNTLTVSAFSTALSMLVEKADNAIGNNFVMLCNEKAWRDIQNVLGDWLARHKTCGTYLWSTAANKMIDVGATFNSYEVAGNVVSFKVDRTLTREYGTDKGFIMMIDLSHDIVTGNPAMQMFTIKNGSFINNRFLGVGGWDGVSSGEVSSPVAASKIINWGYSSVGVFSPYKSFIMREH